MEWFYFKPVIVERPLGACLDAYVLGNVPIQKGKCSVPLEHFTGYPYQGLLFTIDRDTLTPMEIKARQITPAYLRLLYKTLDPESATVGGVAKRVTLPKSKRGALVPYKHVSEVPLDALDRFPHLRWGFRKDDLPLLEYYPWQVLNRIHARHFTEMLSLIHRREDSIHLWAAASERISGLPYFMKTYHKQEHLPAPVLLAQNTWKEMIKRYSETGQRKFDTRILQSKLGEWNVVSPTGGFARWDQQERVFRDFLTTTPVRLISMGNEFTLFYYEMLGKMAGEGTMMICPGEQMRVLHADALKPFPISIFSWSDCWTQSIIGIQHIIVVLSERTTLLQWNDLFKRLQTSPKKVTLVGDSGTKLRIWERGSPFDGFEIACQVQEPEWVSWPMFESDQSMCWQFRAAHSIQSGLSIVNVNVVAREDAYKFVLDSICRESRPYRIPNNFAILCFSPTIMKEVRALHVAYEPSSPAMVPIYGETGLLTSFDRTKKTASLGKREFDIVWPCKIERLNVTEAYRYIGGPVDKLFLILDPSTTRQDIISMLKYANKECTLVSEFPLIAHAIPES